MRTLGCSFRNIAAQTQLPKSTVNNIYRHALENAAKKHQNNIIPESSVRTMSAEPRSLSESQPTEATTLPDLVPAGCPLPQQPAIPLLELLSQDCLNSHSRSGRPAVLSEVEKKKLVDVARGDFKTRRMRLVDLQREAGLGQICRTTALKALHENGIKAYQEDFKFILTGENKEIRQVKY